MLTHLIQNETDKKIIGKIIRTFKEDRIRIGDSIELYYHEIGMSRQFGGRFEKMHRPHLYTLLKMCKGANKRLSSFVNPEDVWYPNKSIEDVLVMIGLKVKELRKNAGYISGVNFALVHGLNDSSYYRLEQGKATNILSLLRACEIHQITLDEFDNLL